MNGIKFYRCVWETPGGRYENTTEAAHSRRYLMDSIKKGIIQYYSIDCETPWELLKVQEMETPLIDMMFLDDLFRTGSTKKIREASAEQADYVKRLVKACAARVLLENGDIIER